MQHERKPPTDLDAVELIQLFGYTVLIDNPDLDRPTPHFHKFTRDDTKDSPSTPLPIVHAAKFAVPCDACYPVDEPAAPGTDA